MEQDALKVGMKPSHPGEFIREEVVEALNLTIGRAAGILGVRRATLSDLLNEKAGLTPEMALRLEKAFGLSMDTLLRMQAWHDASCMREKADQVDVKRFMPGVV
tara:strand:+ start:701 stop:1012 length:312 start_codon:yes stop_codon:yes gene_type:complete